MKRGPGDTSLGGREGDFPKTKWSLLAGIRRSESPERRSALEDLCRRYWKPIYRYLRIAYAKTNEDAKDLTQAFLLWLVEGEALERYASERGSFRRYLKVLLSGFATDQERALHRLKRGGGARVLHLADEKAPMDVPDPAATPAEDFDRAWAIEVAREAMERVGQRLAKEFRIYEEYERGGGTYDDLARKMATTESDVRHALERVRKEIRREILRELADTTVDARELQEEWKTLFGE